LPTNLEKLSKPNKVTPPARVEGRNYGQVPDFFAVVGDRMRPSYFARTVTRIEASNVSPSIVRSLPICERVSCILASIRTVYLLEVLNWSTTSATNANFSVIAQTGHFKLGLFLEENFPLGCPALFTGICVGESFYF
jgi:hypothetical protein